MEFAKHPNRDGWHAYKQNLGSSNGKDWLVFCPMHCQDSVKLVEQFWASSSELIDKGFIPVISKEFNTDVEELKEPEEVETPESVFNSLWNRAENIDLNRGIKKGDLVIGYTERSSYFPEKYDIFISDDDGSPYEYFDIIRILVPCESDVNKMLEDLDGAWDELSMVNVAQHLINMGWVKKDVS